MLDKKSVLSGRCPLWRKSAGTSLQEMLHEANWDLPLTGEPFDFWVINLFYLL